MVGAGVGVAVGVLLEPHPAARPRTGISARVHSLFCKMKPPIRGTHGLTRSQGSCLAGTHCPVSRCWLEYPPASLKNLTRRMPWRRDSPLRYRIRRERTGPERIASPPDLRLLCCCFLTVVPVLAEGGDYGGVDQGSQAAQDISTLTWSEAGGEQPIVQLAGHRKAIKGSGRQVKTSVR